MSLPITQVNVTVLNPPAPSTLLGTGAFVSQGGTNTASGTLTLLTSVTSMASLLAGSQAITALTWSGGVVTATVSGGHGYTVDTGGETTNLTIAGVTPTGYNGTFAATVTSSTQFTYPLASNPGAATVTSATVTDQDVTELNAMNTTFFGQGSNVSVYVLELGASQPSLGVTALQTYINTNPNTIFSWLVPREWDGEASFKTMALNYNTPTSLVNFFVTTTISTYAAWAALGYKCIYAHVEAPSVASAAVAGTATEFSLAAVFYNTLAFNPGSATPVTQLRFSFLYDVTQYPSFGTGTILQLLKTANINYAFTAAEGGLSNTMELWGNFLDGNSFNYWYSVAWNLVNVNLNLTNEIINGSQYGGTPLDYNQVGIDRLSNRAASTLRNGVAYNLILGKVIQTSLDPNVFTNNVATGLYAGNAVINAVPFVLYTQQNPSAYKQQLYGGFQVAMTPQLGFSQIVVNLDVTTFA